MAAAVYPKYKEAVIQASANSALTGTLKAALVDTGTYTYNAAHQFYSDLTGVVGTPVALASRTYTNGLLDAADTVFTAVTGASIEAVVLYLDTGTPSTSRLVAFIDGLTLTPNGGNITAQWNASGIVQF